MDVFTNPYMVISVYNARKQLVEERQQVLDPVIFSRKALYWGATWYMQTPIENLEDGGVVLVEFKDKVRLTTNMPFECKFQVEVYCQYLVHCST